MTRKILGVVASQRKLGNGEIITKEVALAAGVECELEFVRLSGLTLKPCKGCYACLVADRKCCIEDDLYLLVDKMIAADGIILSAPCYAFGPSAVTKLMTDRIIAMAQQIDKFSGKPAVVVATAGIQGWEGYTSSATSVRNSF